MALYPRAQGLCCIKGIAQCAQDSGYITDLMQHAQEIVYITECPPPLFRLHSNKACHIGPPKGPACNLLMLSDRTIALQPACNLLFCLCDLLFCNDRKQSAGRWSELQFCTDI